MTTPTDAEMSQLRAWAVDLVDVGKNTDTFRTWLGEQVIRLIDTVAALRAELARRREGEDK
jgi:hypothetical protein